MRNIWQLQEAKNQFSLVLDNALSRGVPTITRQGEPTVEIISVAEYKKLHPKRRKMVAVLQSCPVKDLDLKRVRESSREASL